ncbi:MAG: His/Gly/Thr/Pro-type tRNA ligase C-terminal domain-containing protein [Pleurocapsa sp. MO_192.B19]|nr:His/Gly/Thr/Pro-type tRNA ligase C-terminal domain-containing protein [Pleurocapsa sp. MO_192.B19]
MSFLLAHPLQGARKERAGAKFKDSELIGIPYRVVTGRSRGARWQSQSLFEGKVEVVKRATRESQDIPLEKVTL